MQLELLYNVGLEIGSTLDTDQLVENILQTSAMMSDARSSHLIKKNNTDEFYCSRSVGECQLLPALLKDAELAKVWSSGENSNRQIITEGQQSDVYLLSLSVSGETVALLGVAEKERTDGSTGPFDTDDKKLLDAFAKQASVALQNSYLHRDLQKTFVDLETSEFQKRRKLLQMEMLYEVGLQLSSTLDPAQIFEEILMRSLVMVDARSAALLKPDDGGKAFSVTNVSSPEEFPETLLTDPIIEKTWSRKNISAMTRSSNTWVNICVIPLSTKEYIGGLLVVADKEHRDGNVTPFEEEDLSLLQSFAYQAGAALSNAVLYRDLESSLVKLKESQDQTEFVQSAFGNYLSPVVVEQLIDHPEMVDERGGDERIMTALFSDIESFSTFSECFTPNQLVDFINEYLTEMCQIIEHHGGTVDKFIGDGIVAFFGAPLTMNDHVERAVSVCIDQQTRLSELRQLWMQESNLPPALQQLIKQWEKVGKTFINVRMGLAAGPIVVGNMGSKTRADYTMMGDTVNLAARIESLQKFYGTRIAVNEEVYNSLTDGVCARPLDILRVMGKTEGASVFEIIGRKAELTEETLNSIKVYEDAINAYRNFDFLRARELFVHSLALKPNDGPSTVYIARCTEYLSNPPDDLIFNMATK
jgi:adenylate cyclase